MPLEETKKTFHYQVQALGRFDKARLKSVAQGVMIAYGRVRGSEHWEIQSYIFDKAFFKSSQDVKIWLDAYLKSQISTLLDFKAWDEWRRRFVNAYVQISTVT